MSDDLNEGEITEIREDTFWGVFGDGTTFDMPIDVLDGHGVGSVVLKSSHDDEDFNHTFSILGPEYATVIFCEDTEEGFEIIEVVRYTKEQFLKDEGMLS